MEGSLNRMGYDSKIVQEELRKPFVATGRVALAAAGLFDTTDLDQELGSNWENYHCIC